MRARVALLLTGLAVLVPTACADGPATGSAADAPSSSVAPVPSVAPLPRGAAGVLPDGFDRVRAEVTAADGTVCELCLWLAADADQRARGLMFATELGPADGMAFVYDRPRTGRFWMKNTVLPLSIAFFDPAGAYMDAFDMEPCTADPCPRYRTPSDFLVAIETVQGGLPAIGIAPGSVLTLTDMPCP